MKKLLTVLPFILSGLFAFAQIDPNEGKTYYDAAKTKPKEVVTFKEVYEFDASDPKSMVKTKVKQGMYFSYYENGKLKVSGNYKNDLKNGEWKYYDTKGTLIKIENYKDDELVED